MSGKAELIYHITFSPKYRRAILTPHLRRIVFGHMRHIAAQKDICIIALATDDQKPDHVHLMLRLPPDMSPAKAVQLLKWYSSCHTRRQIPDLKQSHSRKALWQKSYYARTVGIDRPIVQKYIDLQKHQT